MHQYVRPVKLPKRVRRVWFEPIPIPAPVTAAEHDELVGKLRCDLPL